MCIHNVYIDTYISILVFQRGPHFSYINVYISNTPLTLL